MNRHFVRLATCSLALALVLAISGAALAGPPAPPPSFAPIQSTMLGIQARNIADAVRKGSTARFKVDDPAKLEKIGLKGLNSGDEVEVTHEGDGLLTITNPKTQDSVRVREQP